MNTGDYIAIAVIVLILAAAIAYIIRQKKKGAKCIGCPAGCKACLECSCCNTCDEKTE